MTPSTTTTFFVCSGHSVTSHKSSPEKTYKAIRNEFRQFFIPFHASPTANASHAIFRHQQHVRRRNTQSQHHSSSHPPCWEYGSRPGRTVGICTWRWKHRWHPRRIVGIERRIDNDFTCRHTSKAHQGSNFLFYLLYPNVQFGHILLSWEQDTPPAITSTCCQRVMVRALVIGRDGKALI